ncbi:MAG: hypothetical protein E6J28_04010 [Chloroflexi bacterium]|nr:MAG: hypothetical protein E6J28_04010 [Chloroflexota bacterium]
MTSRALEPPSDSQAVVRTAAFRLLLERSAPLGPDDLQQATGIRRERLVGLLDDLDRAGRIRRDERGNVVGSAGLSVTADRHEIHLDGRRYWTWCAYDILGIFGALGASGRALSPSPEGGKTIEVRFEGGRPLENDVVLFRPDEELLSGCENVYEEWCPNSNLFASRELAASWAARHTVPGHVMQLAEAADLARNDWSDVV